MGRSTPTVFQSPLCIEHSGSATPVVRSGRLGFDSRSRHCQDLTHSRTPDRLESKASVIVDVHPSKLTNGMSAEKYGGGQDGMGEGDNQSGNDFADDSSTHQWLNDANKKPKRKLRWNKFKWLLFAANVLLTVYSLVGLIFSLLIWFNTFRHADILRVGNRTELAISTLACCLGVITSMIGWAGILLNNRSFLAVYTFFLWIVFAFMLVPGYMAYKRRTFNLEGKINAQWSEVLGPAGRLRIQNVLGCCGYFSPFVEATVSQTCYARSILPGCKLPYMVFERTVLKKWYTVTFLLAPVHLAVIMVGLLCSNHVTNRFGKGRMPKAYRLSMTSMAIIMEGYATQLAEIYGSDLASEILGSSLSKDMPVSGR